MAAHGKGLQAARASAACNYPRPLWATDSRARNVVDNFGVETVVYSQATETVRNVNNKPAGRVMICRLSN